MKKNVSPLVHAETCTNGASCESEQKEFKIFYFYLIGRLNRVRIFRGSWFWKTGDSQPETTEHFLHWDVIFKNKKFTAAISLSSRTNFEKGDLATQNATNTVSVEIFWSLSLLRKFVTSLYKAPFQISSGVSLFCLASDGLYTIFLNSLKG